MNRGAILHHSDFVFKDGSSSAKFLIVLNQTSSSDEPILLAKTTSRKKYRNDTSGCCKQHFCYKINKGASWFDKDTWVLLSDIYPFSQAELLKASLQDKQLSHKADLTPQIIDAITNCCAYSDDITNRYKKMIVTV